jgi:hypothetical protein
VGRRTRLATSQMYCSIVGNEGADQIDSEAGEGSDEGAEIGRRSTMLAPMRSGEKWSALVLKV